MTNKYDIEPVSPQHMGERYSGGSGKKILIIIVIGLLLLASLWIWKSIEIKNLKKHAVTEKQEVKKEAALQMLQSHETHLKVLAKPLVWAVRTEMLKNNIGQVNLYTNEMVREPNFQKIVIIDEQGMVLLSTDKKEEGTEFQRPGSNIDLSANTTTVANVNDSLLVMTSPIMGFNNRLGTLLVAYSVPSPLFK